MSLERVANFRDAGGHRTREGLRVRTGVLYRSGHLAHATDGDVEVLEQLGVRVVVDLRGDAERDLEGESRLPRDATLVYLPMGDVRSGPDIRALLGSGDIDAIEAMFPPGAARDMMLRGARAFVVDEEHCAQLARFVQTLVDAEGTPVLVHCSAGKDRTGWATALVLLGLGVPSEQVVADYLLSNASNPGRMANIAQLLGDRLDPALIEPLVVVHEEYITTSLVAVDEHWGGIDAYLATAIGVDEQRRAGLRAVLLEDGG